VRLPFGFGDGGCGIEDRDRARFTPISRLAINRLRAGKRLGAVALRLDGLTQRGLMIFQLNDDRGLGVCGNFKCFFWQWRASRVMI
jgi:hypothetical protein